MYIHGYPWTFMDIHRYQWISIDIRISMDIHGYPLILRCSPTCVCLHPIFWNRASFCKNAGPWVPLDTMGPQNMNSSTTREIDMFCKGGSASTTASAHVFQMVCSRILTFIEYSIKLCCMGPGERLPIHKLDLKLYWYLLWMLSIGPAV